MNFKKHITALLILLMLGMQLLLAQHYTVHFNEDEHIAAHHQAQKDGSPKKNDSGKTDADHVCQICLFSKSISHALDAVFIAVIAAMIIAAVIKPILQATLLSCTHQPYSARAPPTLL